MRCRCVGGQRIPDVGDVVTSADADQASAAVLINEQKGATLATTNECRDQRKSSIKSFRSGLCDIVERPFLRGNIGRGFQCA
jgi:hypothetical protein